MERIVLIQPDQQITDEDLTNIGRHGRASLDHVVKDGIEPGMRFTGFGISQPTVASINVGAGRLYKAGAVYSHEPSGGTAFDLTQYLPINVGNRVIVTLMAWAQEVDTAVEPREFLVDAETDETEALPTATESRRNALLGVAASVEAPTPPVPLVGADQLAIARITLTTAGIISVDFFSDNRLVSASALNDRTLVLEAWRIAAGIRLDTLATDLANIASRLSFIPSPAIMQQLYRDVSMLKEKGEIPDDYSVYAFDHFLDTGDSDTAHSNWLARVEEGIRFPAAASHLQAIQLLNPIDPLAKTVNGVLLPNWSHALRSEVWGRDDEISLSQTTHETVTLVRRSRSRTRTRLGPAYDVCTNASGWSDGRYDSVNGVFQRADGETFTAQNVTAEYGSTSTDPAHQIIRVQQRFVDRITTHYTQRIVTIEGLNGSVRSQTFLNTNPGWLTQVGLALTRVGSEGSLHLLITETNESGAPDFNAVLARIEKPVGELIVSGGVNTGGSGASSDSKKKKDGTTSGGGGNPVLQETKIVIPPTFLDGGKRYAIVLMTSGNHWAAVANGNKDAGGSLFQSTDGAWQQGSATQDLAMRLYYAKFAATRVEIEMGALTLENGIAALDILAECIVPGGTNLIWEYQKNGIWYPDTWMDAAAPHPFVGLPPLLRFRAVFLGTVDIMPGLGIGVSEATTWRPRTDFQHISTIRTVGGTATAVQVRVDYAGFETGHHTATCRLMSGAGYTTLTTPTSTSVEIDPQNPLRRRVTYNFTGLSMTSYRIRIDGTTDSAVNTFIVEQRFDFASI